MGYRDDRDAMMARLDAMERELARAREAAEEGREAKRALAELERERDRLAAEVARLRAEEEPEVGERQARRLGWGGLGAVVGLAGLALIINGVAQCRGSSVEEEARRSGEYAPGPAGPADAAARSLASVERRRRLAEHARLRMCSDWIGGAVRVALARHEERSARGHEPSLGAWKVLERIPDDRLEECRAALAAPEAPGARSRGEQTVALAALLEAIDGIEEYREHEAYRDDDGSEEQRTYQRVHRAATRLASAFDELARDLDREAPAVIAALREETDDAALHHLAAMRAEARELVAAVAAGGSSADLEAAIERALAAGEPLEDASGTRRVYGAFARVIATAKSIRERAGDVDDVAPRVVEVGRAVVASWRFFDASTAYAARESYGLALP